MQGWDECISQNFKFYLQEMAEKEICYNKVEKLLVWPFPNS